MSDDLFDEPDVEAVAEFYADCREALVEKLTALAEEKQLAADQLCDLLTDVAVTYRLVGYVEDTEKPSVAGLRLNLDRFRRQFDDLIRRERKAAPERLEGLMAILAGGTDEEEDETGVSDPAAGVRTSTDRL